MAAVISGVVAYGYALGAIYMRAYWGSFGIDPFQYGSTADVAVAGFSAIAAFSILLIIAAWLGRLIAETASQFEAGGRWLFWGLVVSIAGLVSAALFTGFWWYVLGMIGVWILTLMLILTPTLPLYLRSPPTAALIGLLAVYLPLAAHSQAKSRADDAWNPDAGWIVDQSRSTLSLSLEGAAKVAGRLGDHVVVLEPSSKSVIFLPVSEQVRIVTMPRGSAPASPGVPSEQPSESPPEPEEKTPDNFQKNRATMRALG